MSEVGKAGGRRDVAECWTGREQRRLIRYDFSEALQLAASGMRLGMRLTGGIALGRHHMPFAVRAPQPDCAEGGQAGRGRTCNAQPTQCVHFASATHKNRKARGLVRAGRYSVEVLLVLYYLAGSFQASSSSFQVLGAVFAARIACRLSIELPFPDHFVARNWRAMARAVSHPGWAHVPCPHAPHQRPVLETRWASTKDGVIRTVCMLRYDTFTTILVSTLDVHSRYSKAWGRFRCQPCVTVRLESHPRGGMQEPG